MNATPRSTATTGPAAANPFLNFVMDTVTFRTTRRAALLQAAGAFRPIMSDSAHPFAHSERQYP